MSDHPNHTLQVFDSEEYKDGGWEHILNEIQLSDVAFN